jgi:hypothetical protein
MTGVVWVLWIFGWLTAVYGSDCKYALYYVDELMFTSDLWCLGYSGSCGFLCLELELPNHNNNTTINSSSISVFFLPFSPNQITYYTIKDRNLGSLPTASDLV